MDMATLFGDYLDHLMAYVTRGKATNRLTGRKIRPSETLLRGVEKCGDISEQCADDFRRQVAAMVGHFAYQNKKFEWHSHPQLKNALVKYARKNGVTIKMPKRKPKHDYRWIDDPWEPSCEASPGNNEECDTD